MATEKRVLKDHFTRQATPKPALKHTPKQNICTQKFESACEDKREQRFLIELEQVLQAVNSLQCLGFGKKHAQDERINQLLLSLLTGNQSLKGRAAADLQQVISRRSTRPGINLVAGKAFACAKMHELRPLDEQHEHHPKRKPHYPTLEPSLSARQVQYLSIVGRL